MTHSAAQMQATTRESDSTAEAPGAIGDLVSLAEGQVLLPSFVSRRNDGLWVKLGALTTPGLLMEFVDRVFQGGTRFAGLDYGLFLKLLFDYTQEDFAALLAGFDKAGHPPEMRLADDIVPFPAARRGIYRGVKLLGNGEAAEYLFEQVLVDVVTTAPPADNPDATGTCPDGGNAAMTATERAYLDFDEFVAALWCKGIRYGIDAATVRAAIAADKVERLTIGAQKPPRQGSDASIVEQTDCLHRNDAPRIRPDGRMDLCQFQNRFPQVMAGTRLFKKVPRVMGVSGWNVLGRELPPAAVKDFDINSLAGTGTRVEHVSGNGEYVVAAMDGFLNIDTRSGQVSVTAKIINREGVSARTTGNLALAGDEYEEHGEVQEKRLVEGHHMTFLADVFGRVVSDGGRILIKQNLAGGAARSNGGSIVVAGSASRATLEAKGGTVEVGKAESSVLVGQVVRISHAVMCDIVADEVVIERAEACAIAAKRVSIGQATMRRAEPTIVSLLLPDEAGFDRAVEATRAEMRKASADEAQLRAQLAALAQLADMKTYLSLQPKLQANSIVLTPLQTANWQKLLTRIAPQLRECSDLQGAVEAARQQAEDCRQRIETLEAERRAAIAAVACTIRQVAGETIVRTLRLAANLPPLASLSARELHIRLRERGTPVERIFAGEHGSVAWPPGAG